MRHGHATRRASSSTSICPKARKTRTAVSGDVLIRIMSLKERCCSSEAPGMKALVKTWRKLASCVPQPTSISRASASARSASAGEPLRAQPRE